MGTHGRRTELCRKCVQMQTSLLSPVRSECETSPEGEHFLGIAKMEPVVRSLNTLKLTFRG